MEVLKKFNLGQYKEIVMTARNDTEYVNGLINLIIKGSDFDFNAVAVDLETERIERDLKKELNENHKPFGAFCYSKGITEEEYPDYCKTEYLNTVVEDEVIKSIAQKENITVTQGDVVAYKNEYREQYARIILEEPGMTEDKLELALKTKKVIAFLRENNIWEKV